MKQHLTKKFDKDYESLFHSLTDLPITLKTGETKLFKDILFKDLTKDQAKDHLENLQKNHPLLQIAMPALSEISITDWNDNELIPLVAYIPSKIEGFIPAYGSDGKMIQLSLDEEPKDLTFVIGDNERVVVQAKDNSLLGRSSVSKNDRLSNSTKLSFATQSYDYYLMEGGEINAIVGDELGVSRGARTNAVCDRDRQTKDALNKMIFQDIATFRRSNEWFDGGQELVCKIFFASSSGAISTLEKGFFGRDTNFKNCNWRGKCNTIWFSLGNADIVTWNKATYGDRMLYVWYEHDSGATTTYSTTLTSTFDSGSVTSAVSFSITDGDDLLNQSIVEYCDNTDGDGYQYYTGKIYFYVRQL